MSSAEIRSDVHRIADALAVGSKATNVPVSTDATRDALLAHYHEGYVEGLHDMAEALVAYLSSVGPEVHGRK